MDVSVCIVSLNSIKQLRKCLESLDAGIKPLSYEVIVIDNHSRDGTQEELKKQPFISFIHEDDRLKTIEEAKKLLDGNHRSIN